jgi:DinB superfamily
MMNELKQALIGDSAAAPPSHILEGLPSDLAHRVIQGVPHTINQELWHIAFWQQVALGWVNGIETPFPAHSSAGFPADGNEPWDQLRQRFFRGNQEAAALAGENSVLSAG